MAKDQGLGHRVAELERAVSKHEKLFRTPRNQDIEANRQRSDTAQENHRAEPIPPSIAHVNPTEEQSDATDKAWYKSIPGKIRQFIKSIPPWRVVELIGILAGVFYALVNYWSWRDLRQNFEVSEQAQISATKAEVQEAASGNIIIVVTLANSGHIASKGMVTRITVSRRPNPNVDTWHEYFGGDQTSIAPGTEWKLAFRRRGFTEEERKFSKAQHVVLGLGGVIYYGSGFGATKQAGFCFQSFQEPEIGLVPCDESSVEAMRTMLRTPNIEGPSAALFDQYEERYYREQGKPPPSRLLKNGHRHLRTVPASRFWISAKAFGVRFW